MSDRSPRLRRATLLLLACSGCAHGAGSLVITDATIFDGSGAPPFRGHVVVREGRIHEVLPASATPPEGQRLDAAGRFLMPGLIDLHTHMLRAGSCGADEGMGWKNVRQAAMNFDVALRHGTTTTVDVGGPLHGVLAVREELRDDDRAAPRYLVAGPILTAPGGYPLDWADPELAAQLDFVREVGSPGEAALIVRELADDGVDLIKIAIMEVGYSGAPLPSLDVETARAIVIAAHEIGLKVAVHAHTVEGYRRAVAAGADILAHSSFELLPPDLIAAVAETGMTVVPTLWVFAAFEAALEDPNLVASLEAQLIPAWHEQLRDFDARWRARGDELPDDFMAGITLQRIHQGVEAGLQNLRALRAAGVRVGFGTDTSFCYALHGAAARELAMMRQAGMTMSEALVAATSGSAGALGRTDLGRIEPGALADLILLHENPLNDPTAFGEPAVVIRDGRIRQVETTPPGFFRTLDLLLTLWWAL